MNIHFWENVQVKFHLNVVRGVAKDKPSPAAGQFVMINLRILENFIPTRQAISGHRVQSMRTAKASHLPVTKLIAPEKL
jgi:hypothetical protein